MSIGFAVLYGLGCFVAGAMAVWGLVVWTGGDE